MAIDHGSRWRRWLERGLVVVGVLCLGWTGLVFAQTRLELHRARAAAAAFEDAPSVAAAVDSAAYEAQGPLTGLFEIPRLGLSAALAEGDDDATLRTAIGHLPDTSVPWRGGNTAVAGHRDNLFRALRDVRIGDVIRLKTPRGTFEYAVRTTVIVNPEDVWVVAPASSAELTLVTCYPFAFVGHAPYRYIVKADRIGG